MNIDLHIHSTASDGSCSPTEIINIIQELNLAAFSITDHDTVDGNREALLSGIPNSVNFLTGVEISSYPPSPFVCPGNFHILGYGFNIDDPFLNQALTKFQKAREERNPQIISKLNNAGIDISMDEVINEAGGGLVGRPHIASLLLKKKYVGTIQEAFNKYIAKGQFAYVEKYKIDCKNAIKLIRNAGGIPVLAHPVTLGIEFQETKKLLREMKKLGLLGLEAYYTNHSPENTKRYCQLAQDLGLLITGGSDFHGSFKANINIGTGKGELSVPYHLYETLSKALNK